MLRSVQVVEYEGKPKVGFAEKPYEGKSLGSA